VQSDDTDENERNLLEPSRKVREDVEREWEGKVQKVTDALESKTIWANRLDENVRSYRRRNLELEADLAKSRTVSWRSQGVSDSSACGRVRQSAAADPSVCYRSRP
jgi:centromeric protein E